MVFVTGKLSVGQSARDPDFNFIAHGHPLLYRIVEVLMWEEKVENFVERNGDFVRSGSVANY